MIEIGTLLQNRYLIERKIGAGGMGAVYLAVDQRFGNHVALKETFFKDDEFGAAFEREARLLNGLQHPVLPHVSDYFTEENGNYLVMQFIDGEDLSDVLKRDGAFPLEKVMHWTLSLLDALDYLHSHEPPIIHRDIKPHNLKLTARGEIILLDFGLAKLNYDDKTGEISVFGYSRTYSPLEQIQGTGTNARSDIFALGATVYHLLTGKPPVDALTRASAIVAGQPDPVEPASDLNPDVPPGIASVVHSALALNSENRFVSANVMRQALEHAVRDAGKSEENNEKSRPAIASAAGESGESPISTAPRGAEFLGESAGVNGLKADSDSLFSSSKILIDTAEAAPPVRSSAYRQRLWPVLAAVLVFGAVAAAALFWAGGQGASNQNSLTPVAGTMPDNSNGGNTKSALPNPETVAETKPKPAEKAAAKPKTEESENGTETVENAEPPTDSKNEPARPLPARRKPPTSGDDEINAENGDDAPLDESEFDAEISEQENRRRGNREERRRRQAERPIPDEMSEEEFEQLQRERREKRRQRRNQSNPY